MGQLLNGRDIDNLISDAEYIGIMIKDSVMQVTTEDQDIRTFEINKDIDMYPLIESIFNYTISRNITYGKDEQDNIIDICEHVCESRINNIIKNGVSAGKKITNIALECCAEIATLIARINPLMIAVGGSEFMIRAFLHVYPSIVKKINNERETS